MNGEALSVSQFVGLVNTVFEQVGPVVVEGEVSEFRIIHNKWVTFHLKDETSTIPCFMTVWQLNTQLEDGMVIHAIGAPKLRDKGFFSFVVQTVTPQGQGALQRAFELLRQKLESEGIFAVERKRPLPPFPQHIVLITSEQAAAYGDFLKILQQRMGGLTVSFLHTQVQGTDAPLQIMQALETANTDVKQVDAIVLVRGGGSLEDLQAFNDERVIRAVASSRAPIIVGVGHERDITLAELAADVRASTPSNAAELLVRTRSELTADIVRLENGMRESIHQRFAEQSHLISAYIHTLSSRTRAASATCLRTIEAMVTHARRIREHLSHERQKIGAAERILHSLSPENTLARGYSITRTEAGKVIKRSSDISPDEAVTTTVADGSFTANVTHIRS